MKLSRRLLLVAVSLAAAPYSQAEDFKFTVPMRDRGAATYYVQGQIEGYGATELMVDTGSGYLTINEDALATLKREQRVDYVRQLTGVLADGSEMVVPVYKVKSVTIGENCELRDVEAAVFPGKTRFILGLSALTKAAPFIFSIDPPKLVLSNCLTAATR